MKGGAVLNWIVRADRVDSTRRRMVDEVEKAVERAARNIEGGAKARAPVRTGNLRASISAESTGAMEWTVSVAAEYAAYVNYGTRHTAPNPFFTQAVEAEMSKFIAEVAGIGRTLA